MAVSCGAVRLCHGGRRQAMFPAKAVRRPGKHIALKNK
jgi:hypothetical protein